MQPDTLTDIVNEFQQVVAPPERVDRAAPMVDQTNARIVEASDAMLAFEDSPGDFLVLLAEGQK